MKAVYIGEFGGPEHLELREVDDPPRPAAAQIKVRVRAAGLNRADLLQRRGLYPPPPGYSPNVPGLEFAGEIAEMGPDARQFSIGDRVFGITAGEAQAELILTDENVLARIPDNLTFNEAAAVPEAFITAHDAMFTQGGLSAGETILVHAVGSGVGLAALQLAKANGALVIGTSRTLGKLEKCRALGLAEAIYTGNNTGFSEEILKITSGRGADVVLDLVGAAFFEEKLKSLDVRGRMLLVGLQSGRQARFDMDVALSKRLRIIGTVLRGRSLAEKAAATRRFEKDVVPLLERGTIRANVDRVVAAADVREAHKYLESNASFGKVVLEF
jgi:putative PIG3 family NAD(P)H quinone oxidoreductase